MEATDIKGALGVLHMFINLQQLCKVGGIISTLQWKITTKEASDLPKARQIKGMAGHIHH